jgi:hypothetical protein
LQNKILPSAIQNLNAQHSSPTGRIPNRGTVQKYPPTDEIHLLIFFKYLMISTFFAKQNTLPTFDDNSLETSVEL